MRPCLLLLLLASSCTQADWRAELAAWKHPDPLPSFPLVDDTGRAFNLRELEGPLVVGFVYTRCPVATACPLTMAKLRDVEGVRVLVVTLDPEHDTPQRLAEYKRAHDVTFTMATGTREVVEALTSLFNVINVGGTHPVKLALLDKQLRPVHEWTDNNFDPLQFRTELLHASAAQ